MKKLLLVLIPALMVIGCNTKKPSSEAPTPNTSVDEPGDASLAGNVLKVDYTDDGGANIPNPDWDDGDTAETVRKATYTVDGKEFSIEFVGKWYISTGKQEYQTKKDPVSYVRAASNYIVSRVVIEVFKADIGVFKTLDHTGDKVEGTAVTAEHGDGDATEYTLNTQNWSFLAEETYKGGSVNIYSFTFYF